MHRPAIVRCLMLFPLCATAACDDERSPRGSERPAKQALGAEQARGDRHFDDEGKFGKSDPAKRKARRVAQPDEGERAKPAARTDHQQARGGEKQSAMDALQVPARKGPNGASHNVVGSVGLGMRGQGAGGGGSALGIGGLGSGKGSNQSLGGLRGASYGSASGRGGLGMTRATVSSGSATVVERAPPSPGGRFVHAGTNRFTAASEDNRSTFAIDVDTGSYAFARAFLQSGSRPPAASVRVEEWINAHRYGYVAPGNGGEPFRVHLAAGPSPFSGDKHLLRVALQGKRVSPVERKATHLTFLVDVSGSMDAPDKLPLVRESLHLLVDQLRDDDSVALVTYAGATRLVLPSTSAAKKRAIHAAIDTLTPGGGTAMGSGMEIAYRQAALQLSDEKMSRVLVLSDGDANIGRTSHEGILDAVRGWVSEGVTLSTLGFGRGNYNDHLMEGLADAGNGNYTYLDSREAARRFFRDDLVSMLQVIAQDVKVRVEMNPKVVRGYRLVGYENRDVADEDFTNDKVDGGEIGAGHAVTALYELDLVEGEQGELVTVRVRAKEPRGLRSTESVARLSRAEIKPRFDDLDADARFASGIALTAEILRGSPYVSHLSLSDAEKILAGAATGPDAKQRNIFLSGVRRIIEAERSLARR